MLHTGVGSEGGTRVLVEDEEGRAEEDDEEEGATEGRLAETDVRADRETAKIEVWSTLS